jgi:isoaspartyl peptidase/L-asparaginase-like protein (Ntn-hydrolase superfamily)
VLRKDGTALDAVTETVKALEDDTQFNAGRGSVLTSEGRQEMDASIMDGQTRAAGAVANILGPKNPVVAARRVMERTPHVLLVGEGALAFCRAQDLEFKPPAWFVTEDRVLQLEQVLAARSRRTASHGTVGAVARDRQGNLAAATSTGGTTGKLPGRVGDSCLDGAGTFADNQTCAVSCTGEGEYFIRWAVGMEIAARMRHLNEDMSMAAQKVLDEVEMAYQKAGFEGGVGGLIAVDRNGNLTMPLTTPGMCRGFMDESGQPKTAIFKEELPLP